MQELIKTVQNYVPKNEQEASDRELMLSYAGAHPGCLFREDKNAHFTASALIMNRDFTKVCFVYHKIYDSWSWVGGHADGDADLLRVALKEAAEETGLTCTPVSGQPISLEILTVSGHEKKGCYVSSHLHYNLTYLVTADENMALTVKPDENAGVRWFTPEEALRASTEPWMVERIYQKLFHTVVEGRINL